MRFKNVWMLVIAARKKGNGFAYYTGDLGWMLKDGGNIDNPWDYQLCSIMGI